MTGHRMIVLPPVLDWKKQQLVEMLKALGAPVQVAAERVEPAAPAVEPAAPAVEPAAPAVKVAMGWPSLASSPPHLAPLVQLTLLQQ